MKQANVLVRNCLKENKVKQWQLCDSLGIREYTLSRMLRRELTTAKQNELCKAIKEIAERSEES